VGEAAAELGLPERAVYRQIAAQALRARRDERGALQVCLDETASALSDQTSILAAQEERQTALTPERARALSELASGLLGPLVERLAHQDTVIREQAEEIGRLRAHGEQVGEAADRLAPAFARQLAELAAIREEIEQLASRRRWWLFG
jgi:hypothetical protein